MLWEQRLRIFPGNPNRRGDQGLGRHEMTNRLTKIGWFDEANIPVGQDANQLAQKSGIAMELIENQGGQHRLHEEEGDVHEQIEEDVMGVPKDGPVEDVGSRRRQEQQHGEQDPLARFAFFHRDRLLQSWPIVGDPSGRVD